MSPATLRPRGDGPRVLYVQYFDPAAYPPLRHSAELLAEAGSRVRVLGTTVHAPGFDQPPAPRLDVRRISTNLKGRLRHLHYLTYTLWALWHAVLWRPKWVYCSDFTSAPIALLLDRLPGIRVIYHEHDAPSTSARSLFVRFCLAARRRLRTRGALFVAPNAARAALLPGGGEGVITVPNFPRRSDARPHRPSAETLRLLYHGSIVPERLPVTIVQALALVEEPVELSIVGYETVGSTGYLDQLMAEATRLGVAHRVRILGRLMRSAMLDVCARSDLGVVFVPFNSSDVNLASLVGASNKAFECLACGAALLVADRPAWRAAFVEPGFGRACDPEVPDSIAHALRWAATHREEVARMGAAGQRRVVDDWNYESAFAPVREIIEDRGRAATARPAATLAPMKLGHGGER